ncbi:MAG: AAA family ATPase [Candidatus Ornithospirochaeta sp.]|nr:AAA family ATPase [Candidatus Ornithospirochaeta sp.]
MEESGVILFVTGCPGSGKTGFAERIRERFPFFAISSYDALKDEYFDRYGFDSLEERAELNSRSLREYYSLLSSMMEKRMPIITDYPFNRLVHEKDLSALVTGYSYTAMTITLYGDCSVLLERGTKRDRTDSGRNPGHYLTRYHKESWSESDRIPIQSLEEFTETIERKDYFMRIGRTMAVDVTDFSKVDYEGVFSNISMLLSTQRTQLSH